MRRTIGPGIFVSFAIGLGVGTVAGLLFAPKPGELLREEIARGAAARLDQVRSTNRKIGKRAQTLVDRANSEINDAVEAGEKAYSNAKES
jgi:gas vesicle protein